MGDGVGGRGLSGDWVGCVGAGEPAFEASPGHPDGCCHVATWQRAEVGEDEVSPVLGVGGVVGEDLVVVVDDPAGLVFDAVGFFADVPRRWDHLDGL